MSVAEMWDIVWSNDGIYDLDKALEHFGDKYGERVMWEPAEEGQTWKKEPVIATKTVQSKSKLPPNPLQEFIDGTSVNYLLKQDDLGMVISQMNTGHGFLYADAPIVKLRWELHQPTPNSKRCVLRHSHAVAMSYKPWGFTTILENLAHDKVTEAVKYLFDDFFPTTIEDYFTQLEESGNSLNSADGSSKMAQIRNEVRHGLDSAILGADQNMEEQQMQMNMMCGVMATALLFLCCLAPFIMRYRNQE